MLRDTKFNATVLQGKDEETESFYHKGNLGSIFGDKAFRQSIVEDKKDLQVSTELPKVLSARPELEEIVASVAKVFKNSNPPAKPGVFNPAGETCNSRSMQIPA